jgi:hypothetical protein
MKLTKKEQIKEQLSSLQCTASALYKSNDNYHADDIVYTVSKILSILNQK